MEKIIDASDLVLGRMCTRIAKMALLSEDTIHIINCEKAIVSGKRSDILEKYRHRRERVDVFKGPFFPRKSERIVKRTLRGMLPYKQYKGLTVFKRIMCHEGVPEVLAGKKAETISGASIKNSNIKNFIYVKDIAKELGK